MAKIDLYLDEYSYRLYMSDAIKTITENSAKYAGGSIIKKRYADILNESKKPVDNRSAEQIVSDVLEKAGIEVIYE